MIRLLFDLQIISDIKDLLLPLIFTIGAFTIIFILCEVGERIMDPLNEINNDLWMSDWYTFPVSVRKKFPILIHATQKPFLLSGFGNIQCSRKAFENVTFFKTQHAQFN